VVFGNFTALNQVFAETTIEPDVIYRTSPFDGILGLAFQSIAVDHVKPVFDTLMEQGVFERNQFSFYLSSTPGDDSSALMLGTFVCLCSSVTIIVFINVVRYQCILLQAELTNNTKEESLLMFL